MTKKNNIIKFPSASRLATIKRIMSDAEPTKSLSPTSFEKRVLDGILRLEAILKKTA